jgi:tight adherence protein C
MSPIVITAALAIAGAVAVIGWLVLAPKDRTREQVLANASHGLATDTGETSVLRPGRSMTEVIRLMAPPRVLAGLDRRLALAGRPAAWTIDRILLAKLILPVAAAGAGAGWLYVQAAPSPGRILLAVVVTVVTFFVPDLLLISRGQERQAQIAVELPDTLDQMTIAVEAGLGFEAAMMRTAKNGTGPLADELTRTLQDIQFGRSRRDAYLALSDRSSVKDLSRFLRAVTQADAYGIAIADVLRTQASEMRLKRRQRAEEKAMKIPVKVIFPLMLCILPALFVVVLGPAVLDMMKEFGAL